MRAYNQLLDVQTNSNADERMVKERVHSEPNFDEAASVLTPKRIKALDSVGFSWEIERLRRHLSWEERYNELAQNCA